MAVNGSSQLLQPRPNPDLKRLDKLAGTWKITGAMQGTITFEWMEGGFFLVQHVDLEHDGQKIRGMEIIGHEQKFGTGPSKEIRSRFYSFIDGMTPEYEYELEGGALTIWMGEKGAPDCFTGQISEDGNSLSGEWVYPGGSLQISGSKQP